MASDASLVSKVAIISEVHKKEIYVQSFNVVQKTKEWFGV